MTNIVICGANGKMGHTVAACIAQRTDCKVIGGIDVYTKAYGDFPIVEQPNLLPEKPLSPEQKKSGTISCCAGIRMCTLLAAAGI